jgi:hypothetical protein
MKRFAQIAILAIAVCCAAAHATPSFTVTPPGGAVSGSPGNVVGWGFTIINDTNFFLIIDGSAFCGPGGDPQFTDCTKTYNGLTQFGPALGTYTDFIANYFSSHYTVVSPNTSYSQAFNPSLGTGVGEYFINPGAIPGSHDPGNLGQFSNLFISYVEFLGSPYHGGQAASGDIELHANVSVTVGSAPVPEPATMGITGAALLLLGALRLRRPYSL